MDVKFFDSLFEGDSANGVKLCMGLTSGDFWARSSGCQNIYRGQTPHAIDFENIITVNDPSERSIVVPTVIEHQAQTKYYYVLRRANICGNEEKSFNAAVKVVFDGEGEVIEPGCNKVFSITAEQIAGGKLRLLWHYNPIGQEQACSAFKIYFDSDTGQVDYNDAIATIQYTGSRYYNYQTNALDPGRYLFAIRTVNANGNENSSTVLIAIEIINSQPESVDEVWVHSF